LSARAQPFPCPVSSGTGDAFKDPRLAATVIEDPATPDNHSLLLKFDMGLNCLLFSLLSNHNDFFYIGGVTAGIPLSSMEGP
jgi:hypothetical protein